jgi:type IX secretion system PorP/SprF family membrane protein
MNILYFQKQAVLLSNKQDACIGKMPWARILFNNFGFFLGLHTLCLLTFFSSPGYGQLYQFSQYYNTLQLINPAYVGSSGHVYKASTISRLQWVNIAENYPVLYQTYAASGHFIFGHPYRKSENIKKRVFASAGLSFIRNSQGDGSLKYTSILPAGAVMVRIGSMAYLSAGVEVSFNQYTLDNYVLVNDYLNDNFMDNPAINENSKTISTGLMLIMKQFWLGFSFKDVLLQSFTNGNILIDTGNEFYDNFYLQGGISLPFNQDENQYITSSVLFKKRSQNAQLEGSVGFVQSYQSGYAWTLSAAYRGLWQNVEGLKNADAFALIAGFSIPNYYLFHKNSRMAKDWGSLGINISSDFLHAQFDDSFRTWEVSIILNAPSRKGGFLSTCVDYLHGPLAEQITQNFYLGKDPYSNKSSKK